MVALPLAALPLGATAKGGAHVHGLVKLDVAVDGKMLSLQLDAPVDSLLGFEHRPRTAAQKQAVEQVLKQMQDAAALFTPDAAALCKPTSTTVVAETLQKTNAPSDPKTKEPLHADLEARFEFTCEQPDKLGGIELGLFNAFKRIQTVQVQIAGAKGQSKATLKRPLQRLTLKP
jgi:hypothetical protein